MSIAQQLCDEIVEPAIIPSLEANLSSSTLMHRGASRHDGRTTRSVVIEKKKVINNLAPRDKSGSRTVVNKFKSRETLMSKTLVDMANNTLISGPLRCDNNCLTMVHRRDIRCACKCSQKKINFKASVKQIQTFDQKNVFKDKACAQCVETVSCGTQFLERLSRGSTQQVHKDSKLHVLKESKPSIVTKNSSRIKYGTMNGLNKSSDLSNFTARRWAVSQYPVRRGPDF